MKIKFYYDSVIQTLAADSRRLHIMPEWTLVQAGILSDTLSMAFKNPLNLR